MSTRTNSSRFFKSVNRRHEFTIGTLEDFGVTRAGQAYPEIFLRGRLALTWCGHRGWLMDRGVGYPAAHRVSGWSHQLFGTYDPAVIREFPDLFNVNWRNHWGMD